MTKVSQFAVRGPRLAVTRANTAKRSEARRDETWAGGYPVDWGMLLDVGLFLLAPVPVPVLVSWLEC